MEHTREARSHHRWLQRLANHSFWDTDPGDGSCPSEGNDVRLEAAFRCWLRCLDVDAQPPDALPDESELGILANRWDTHYGEDAWWAWATWSSCHDCHGKARLGCAECAHLYAFAGEGLAPSPRRDCDDTDGSWSSGSGEEPDSIAGNDGTHEVDEVDGEASCSSGEAAGPHAGE